MLIGTAAGSQEINYNGAQFLRLARWGGGGRNWEGTVDDLRIWNRALSGPEIVAGMTGTLTGSEPNLVGWWKFDEGYGDQAADWSPSNHIATLVNGPTWVSVGPTNTQSPGLLAQYQLDIDLADTQPPTITSVSLPTDGSTNAAIWSAFTVGFDEDVNPAFNALSRNVYRYGGHSYVVTDTSGSWPNAESQALNMGGHLVAINDADENNWLDSTFSAYSDLWIGLNDVANEGTFVWVSGDPVTYTHWAGGQPDNSGNQDYVRLNNNSYWYDEGSQNYRGIAEVTNTIDSDGDGLVNSLDPYPNDPLNGFDLRAAGSDGLFDTPDDVVYRIYTTGYSSGLSTTFTIADGPLQPGRYRFMITTSLKDKSGNTLAAPFVQYFTIASVNELVVENRDNNSFEDATSLSLDPSNALDGSFAYLTSIATGNNPEFLASGYFNSDTNLDLVVANLSSDNVSVLLGDGSGYFQVSTNIPTGNGAISVVANDLNADGKVDFAVANYYAGTVSILLGDGNGGFQILTNYAGFGNPDNLAVEDFNHDGEPDLAVPNYESSGKVFVLLGNGDGTFAAATSYTVENTPQTVAVGDFNGDTHPDLVVANYNSGSLSILMGNADGSFQAATSFPTAGSPRYVAVTDLNKDSKLDMVSVGGTAVSVFFGNGDGTFQPEVDYSPGNSDAYQILPADLDGDGWLDLVIASYGNNRLITMMNQGDGTFGGVITYTPGGNPRSVVAADFNHDGRMDLATANYNGDNVYVFLGNNTQPLAYDPAGTGLRIGAGRGNLSDGNDVDYWSFTAEAGDRIFIGTENVGNPNSSGLLYRIYDPSQNQWTSFYTDYNGRGQISLIAGASGTYYIRVDNNYSYSGEYRFRVTLARPPVQMESEDNSSIANANTVSFTLTNGRQTALMLGYIGNGDGSGDFFKLGNLSGGTTVNLDLSQPASSGLLGWLGIYDGSGTLVTNVYAGATNVSYLIPTGADGAYYARVSDGGPVGALSFGGVNGYALRFDGGSDWVAFDGASIPDSGDFTVECWAYGYNSSSYREIISQGTGGNAFYLGYASDDTVRSGDGWQSTGVPFPFNAWHHLAIVKSSTNTLLYIDGALAATKGSTIPNPSQSGPLRLARQYGSNGEYWPGYIDEVRILECRAHGFGTATERDQSSDGNGSQFGRLLAL